MAKAAKHITLSDTPAVSANGAASGLVLVSGAKLGEHFGVSRQQVDRLTADGVIERRPDGLFDQDQSRLKYFNHLRAEHRRSPRTLADVEHANARTAWLRLRVAEREGRLIELDEAVETVEAIMGVVLTHLSGMAARCTRDLSVRRAIDAVVYEVRTEMADVASRLAQQRVEPPPGDDVDLEVRP